MPYIPDDKNDLYSKAHSSFKLRGAETSCSAANLEALAVVESIKHFNAYLYR